MFMEIKICMTNTQSEILLDYFDALKDIKLHVRLVVIKIHSLNEIAIH